MSDVLEREIRRLARQLLKAPDLEMQRNLVKRMSRKLRSPVIYDQDASDQYYTPKWLRELATELLLGRPDLDPATSRRNPLKARRFYTLRALERDWAPDAQTLYLNPPYGREIAAWLLKLAVWLEHDEQRDAVLLVPARPGCGWYIAQQQRCAVLCELKGRVTYEDATGKPVDSPARWASALIYYTHDAARASRARRILAKHGEIRNGGARLIRRAAPVLADPRQLHLVTP